MPLVQLSKICQNVFYRVPKTGDDLVANVLKGRGPENMVELAGIEPATSGLQNRRSPN